MWAVVAVILLAFLSSVYFMNELKADHAQAAIEGGQSIERQVGMIGAQVAVSCARQTAPGVYTQTALLGGSFPATTPVGNSFICIVRSGGSLPTGNVAIVLFDQAPVFIPGKNASNDAVRLSLAAGVAAYFKDQVGAGGGGAAALPDSIAGIVRQGSTAPTLEPVSTGETSVDLTGLLASNFPYHTPVIVAGLIRSTW